MLNVHALALGAYQTNCYIIHDEKSTSCCVVDPGYEADTILDKLTELGLSLEAILLTHGHFDHVGAVAGLTQALRCPVWMHENELTLPEYLTDGPLYYTDGYGEGDTVTVGGLQFTVLHTPGHTPGSVCLRCGDALFSGDTLFAGSCGRTDFSGGSGSEMCRSLRRLAQLPGDLAVYPGHGEATTLAREKRENPYLR